MPFAERDVADADEQAQQRECGDAPPARFREVDQNSQVDHVDDRDRDQQPGF